MALEGMVDIKKSDKTKSGFGIDRIRFPCDGIQNIEEYLKREKINIKKEVHEKVKQSLVLPEYIKEGLDYLGAKSNYI